MRNPDQKAVTSEQGTRVSMSRMQLITSLPVSPCRHYDTSWRTWNVPRLVSIIQVTDEGQVACFPSPIAVLHDFVGVHTLAA